MTPKELYPIGTQLITRRLSQAALAYELGFWVETQDSTGEWCNSFHVDANVIEIVGEDTDVCVAEFASTWRVIVTAENQKWLSPAFVLELNKLREIIGSKTTYTQEVKDAVYDAFFEMGYHRVLRTYPNGQRAPFIEWNEMILPKTGELS